MSYIRDLTMTLACPWHDIWLLFSANANPAARNDRNREKNTGWYDLAVDLLQLLIVICICRSK